MSASHHSTMTASHYSTMTQHISMMTSHPSTLPSQNGSGSATPFSAPALVSSAKTQHIPMGLVNATAAATVRPSYHRSMSYTAPTTYMQRSGKYWKGFCFGNCGEIQMILLYLLFVIFRRAMTFYEAFNWCTQCDLVFRLLERLRLPELTLVIKINFKLHKRNFLCSLYGMWHLYQLLLFVPLSEHVINSGGVSFSLTYPMPLSPALPPFVSSSTKSFFGSSHTNGSGLANGSGSSRGSSSTSVAAAPWSTQNVIDEDYDAWRIIFEGTSKSGNWQWSFWILEKRQLRARIYENFKWFSVFNRFSLKWKFWVIRCKFKWELITTRHFN